MADRVAHLAGNAISTEWPAGHDVVLMSYVWSAVGGADIAVLARRAFDALPSGGLVLVHDFMVDNAYERAAIRRLVPSRAASSTIRTRCA